LLVTFIHHDHPIKDINNDYPIVKFTCSTLIKVERNIDNIKQYNII
jgi:hypothetical protein